MQAVNLEKNVQASSSNSSEYSLSEDEFEVSSCFTELALSI